MNLFNGKRKRLTIPIAIFLGLMFFPIAIGVLMFLGVKKYIANPKLKKSLYTIIGVLTLFFGSAWLVALATPSEKSTQTAKNEVPAQIQTTPTQPIQQPQPTIEQPTVTTPKLVEATFLKVVDGDTIEAMVDGKKESIRIIGINTPETVDPRKLVECFGKEATNYAKNYFDVAFEGTTSKKIWLEADPSQDNRDKYNRLLRYVFTDDGSIDYAILAIKAGFGYEYTYDLAYKYQSEYKQAQREAERKKLGLWADNACAKTITPSKSPVKVSPTKAPVKVTPIPQVRNIAPTSPPAHGGACMYSCSSPDRDCGDFSSHSQAQAFFQCCGFTADNDPMRLDSVGVGDGVACESL